MTVVVQDSRLVPRYGFARRTRADRPGLVGDEDVQDLRRADPVQDLHPVAFFEPLEDRRWERLAGRNAPAHRREVAFALVGQDLGIVGRHGEEERRPMRFDDLEHVGRRWRTSKQHRGAAHAEWEVQPVAQAIGKEELGHAEAAVTLGHVQHATGVQIGAHHHVTVLVNAALGKAGAAR